MQNRASNSPSPSSSQPSQGPTLPVGKPRQFSRGLRTGAILLLALMLSVVFGTGLFAGWQFGNTRVASIDNARPATKTGVTVPPLQGENEDAIREAVIAKVRPAVVQINVVTQRGQGLGSGVVIDQRGYIITNNHVVDGARQVEVMLYNGTRLPAQIVGTDAPDDLAVLKVSPSGTNVTVAALGDSSKLKVGQEVLALGNPLGITQTVTSGIVSAVNRTVGTIPDAIQTDAAINPGNSGGALVDLEGKLIGIPTATALDPQFKTPANGVGFAVPSNRVQLIAPQIIETGKVTNTGRAALGVRVTTVDPILAIQNHLATERGALITSVMSDGAAAQAGLRPGDVILRIDDQEVNDVSSLGNVLLNKKPGERVSVQVYRGTQQLTVNVKLGELRIE
ncbi:MAG: S1C family serine protease [Ktedonobacteraceae bacterium]